jgi:hypothetical protein
MSRAGQRLFRSALQAVAFARGEPVEGTRLSVHGHRVELSQTRAGSNPVHG